MFWKVPEQARNAFKIQVRQDLYSMAFEQKSKHRVKTTCLTGTDGDRLTFATALRKLLGDICYLLLSCVLNMDKKPCEDNRTNVSSVFDDLHK